MSPRLERPRCRCGAPGELRYCAANDSGGYQCASCDRPLSRFLPKCLLPGVALERLPRWVTRAERRPGMRQLALIEVRS